MSAASGIGSTSNSNAQGTGGFGQLSSEEFIKVLTTELSHQDPFKPADSSALLEQLSSLRNIESQLSLQKQLTTLVLQNQIASAGNLIGKLVEGLDAENRAVAGQVTSVRVENGKAILELDSGQSLQMERVTEIADRSVAG